jgi:hypothetical protein
MIRNATFIVTHPPLGNEIISANTSSKVDVYDYAAQFDTVPQFETIKIPLQLPQKFGYHVRVTVKGTTIVGEGFHSTQRAFAEIGACVSFKKRAEELHQGERMLVKHINTLTSQTGRKFLQYCSIKQKDWEQYNFVSKSIGPQDVHGKLYVGERLVSECVMFKYVPNDLSNNQ